MSDKPTYLTVKEAAELLDYHPQSIRDLTRLKRLPAVKVGWLWMFDKKVLLDLQKKAKAIGSTPSKVYLTQRLLTGK